MNTHFESPKSWKWMVQGCKWSKQRPLKVSDLLPGSHGGLSGFRSHMTLRKQLFLATLWYWGSHNGPQGWCNFLLNEDSGVLSPRCVAIYFFLVERIYHPPTKTHMTSWKIISFKRRYIFKWLRVRFRGSKLLRFQFVVKSVHTCHENLTRCEVGVFLWIWRKHLRISNTPSASGTKCWWKRTHDVYSTQWVFTVPKWGALQNSRILKITG